MINVGLVLLIIGIVIAATALIFAVRNMYKGMKAAASILRETGLVW